MKDTFLEDQRICTDMAGSPDEFEGAVIPPVYGSTLFTFGSFEELTEAEKNQQSRYVYSRGTNPTVQLLEKKLAALERGEACKCFSSGMAAISAAILSSVKSGDHVLCIGNLYFSTLELLNYLKKFQVDHSVVYSTKLADIESAIRENTAVIYIESPTDTKFEIIDLESVSGLAKSRGITSIMDNSWATPLFQKPILHGIDLVVHSASKYIGGHSDVIGGALIASQTVLDSIFKSEYLLQGGVMGPYEASLLLRGMRSLPLRMLAHQENALKVASFLSGHDRVAEVHYPGLPQNKNHSSAKKYFSGYSGLMSFELKNGAYNEVKGVINRLRVFKIGVSWGSYESLVLSPNYGYNEGKLKKEGISPGIIRLSVGLGDAGVLIDDLDQALE
ncbi:trans-sulfuration enzyme family protein [Peribacillus kribbensis]|uniref:trans-sulfuration enzyme family protein n=1 Tax=Peribacillus kribbensis TaxID=356658 RepID=UPI00040DD77C|nr:aminotransferase class I/II-fold pyridoxal phosphate-dependent enzyme [Peribacillus kribbensis]